MKKLKKSIRTIVLQSQKIDWMIVHAIGKEIQGSKSFEFSFVDGKERFDEPFKTNQGYISLKNAAAIKSFTEFTLDFTLELKGNILALSNFFIVITRISYAKEDKQVFIEDFRKLIGSERKIIFGSLVKSLNLEYFKHRRSEIFIPKDTEDWLMLLRQSQYYHGISNPIMSILALVRTERGTKMKFSFIAGMDPILRSYLFGWFGFDILITKAEMKTIRQDENELMFLSACLIDNRQTVSNNWISKDLIDQFIENHWDKIGKHLFKYIFGLNYRNKNENPLYKKMEHFYHSILHEKLRVETETSQAWIAQLSFPESFISLFTWIKVKKVKFSSITQNNWQLILDQFIAELQKISKELPNTMSSENRDDPFMSFQLHEPKYQNALAYILLLFLYATPDNLKFVSKICYRFKPLFFGGYKATRLASDFTELILLIALSGDKINGVGEEQYKNLVRLLKIIEDSLLIPYVHTSEREEEIWNPESEKDFMSFTAGKHLVNVSLFKVKNHEVSKYYQQLFQKMEEIKVAEWPYERIKSAKTKTPNND